MQKDLIFFGERGITDTQANRVADLAKMAYTDDESYLESLSFIDQSVETINGDNAKELSFGATSLADVTGRIEHIGKLKSLCAWLREAIQAHQRLIAEIKVYSIADYMKDNNIEAPKCAQKEAVIDENDVIASFDIKKRNRYYYLEAMAATIGKFIHKGGRIDMARKEYYDKLTHPRQTIGTGNEMLIYTFKPSLDKGEIEEKFYGLQQLHASYQSELNSIKSEIQSRITNDEIDKTKAYEIAYEEYSKVYDAIVNKFNTWKAEEQKRVAALKIIIPDALKLIYEEVSSGKKGIK